MSDERHALVRRLFEEVFNGSRLEVCDEIVARRFVEHALAPFQQVEPGEVDGPEHMRRVVGWLRAQFSDIEMTVQEIVAEGDRVAARVLTEGTNDGKLNGMLRPTGKRFAGSQSHWYRVTDGKLSEHWAVRDDLTLMIQLGLVPIPPGSIR